MLYEVILSYAKVVSSGTHHMMSRLEEWGIKGEKIKIPSVVDHNRFIFNEKARARVRNKFGLSENKKLVIYPGKFGDLYYDNEIGVLFKSLLNCSHDYFFLILTLTDQDHAKEVMLQNGIPEEYFFIGSASYGEMSDFLSASDLGVVSVPPLPSKKFCSNIKVGEYLCNGLPYLICRGVSEDDEYAERKNVGVVIEEFNEKEGLTAHNRIIELLEEDKATLNERCRQAGMEYRSFESLNPLFMGALNRL